MLKSKDSTIAFPGEQPIETSALTVRNTSNRFNGDQRNNQRRGHLWCNHCNRAGHTRDTCWDIHGKPTNWKPKGANKGRGFQASVEGKREETRTNTESNGVFLNKSQLEQLQKLLNQPTVGNSGAIASNSGGAVSNFAHQGTAFHVKNFTPWILDSGASDI